MSRQLIAKLCSYLYSKIISMPWWLRTNFYIMCRCLIHLPYETNMSVFKTQSSLICFDCSSQQTKWSLPTHSNSSSHVPCELRWGINVWWWTVQYHNTMLNCIAHPSHAERQSAPIQPLERGLSRVRANRDCTQTIKEKNRMRKRKKRPFCTAAHWLRSSGWTTIIGLVISVKADGRLLLLASRCSLSFCWHWPGSRFLSTTCFALPTWSLHKLRVQAQETYPSSVYGSARM